MHKIDPADEAQLFATIDRWVEREVAPQVKEFDHADKWPAEIVEQMKELGLFGATVSPEYGSDHELSAQAMDAKALHAKLAKYRPAAVAFTSKNAASLGLGVKAPAYGRQRELLEGAVVFVLASPSGRARSFWTLEPWRAAAAFVMERRLLRERAA